MVGNKKRIYVALYPSGVVNNEERRAADQDGKKWARRFHWGFLVGPKKEPGEVAVPGMRYNVRNMSKDHWVYEERALANVRNTAFLLVRVTIGKVTDEERLVEILRSVPVVQNDTNWRCRTWVRNALSAVKADGTCVGASVLNWAVIEAKAREYAAEKLAAGRFNSG